MTILPIVERELRVRARQRATYWTRFAAVLLGLLIGLPQLEAAGRFGGPAQTGKGMFDALIVVAFIWCCVAWLTTVDAISSERREGTLGLLFLTDLKGWDVVLGKLASGGLIIACALVGFLPLVMIPILAGGVSPGEAARKVAVLLNTILCTLAAGLWASARGSEVFKRACVALVLVVPVVILAVLSLVASSDANYGSTVGVGIYWLLVGLVQALGWLLLLTAHRRMQASLRESNRPAWHAVLVPAPADLAPRISAPLSDGEDPIEWFVRHQRGVRGALWLSGIMLLGQSGILAIWRGIGFSSQTGVWFYSITAWTLEALAHLPFAWATTRFFQETRRTGEVEVLLSTPWGADGIVRGQWQALRKLMRWPVILSLAAPIVRVAVGLASLAVGWRDQGSVRMLPYDPLNILIGLTTAVAMCWLGMRFGLSARRPVQAIAWTLGLGCVLPAGIGLSLWPIFAVLSPLLASSGLTATLNLFYFLCLLAVLLALIFWARRRLYTDLRCIAFARFSAREDLAEIKTWLRTAIQRARHWTLPA